MVPYLYTVSRRSEDRVEMAEALKESCLIKE